MNSMNRTSPILVAAYAAAGIAAGLLLQFWRSNQGLGPLVPTLSLPFTLLVLGLVLVSLGVALRRAVTNKSGKPVNPFHAVRLLAGAKAGQLAGALLGGFGGGLALQLLTRSVMPPVATWLPMLLVLFAGVVLVVCGLIAESLCRVPPSSGDAADENTNGEPEPDAV